MIFTEIPMTRFFAWRPVCIRAKTILSLYIILYDFLGTVKAAPHECVIRTCQP